MKDTKPRIALLTICLNEPYWQYIQRLYESANEFLFADDSVEVDYILFTDMPEVPDWGGKRNITVIPTIPQPWPMPTLMRYHTYLTEKELLKEYDYIFHCDVDMLFVAPVGGEILSDGITACMHPMWTTRKGHEYAPFDPNPNSTAYVNEEEYWKNPTPYYAGGFQGGTTDKWIGVMESLRKSIDADFMPSEEKPGGYIARWNEESHWNRYLLDNPPDKTLDPSYIWPDSLIEEYYGKIWPEGHGYSAKLVTLTKPFTITKAGGDAVRDKIKRLDEKPKD
jgi:hypothetical protein